MSFFAYHSLTEKLRIYNLWSQHIISKQRPIKIGIVAGEMSGDLLGAGLIAAIKTQYPSVEFIGIGGPQMLKDGFHSLVPMEELSVMGISGVILRYFKLRKICKQLAREFTESPPDLFVGIDYSYFNLLLEALLKKQGVKTVQYVSPKVWAWRQKRVFKIKKATDLVLTLFPFEKQFYDKYNVPAQFVGHPLADYIELDVDANVIKRNLGYTAEDQVIAVLPGSRVGELKHMGPLFLDVMHDIQKKHDHIHFVVPMASQRLRQKFEEQIRLRGYRLNIQITNGESTSAMAASDVVIVKSGTATLEAMLLKRPMVVAYKCSALSYAIVAPQVKVPYAALPNLLANQYIVPEFIQTKAQAKPIADAVLAQLDGKTKAWGSTKQQFETIHLQLRQNANERAATAILKIINER